MTVVGLSGDGDAITANEPNPFHLSGYDRAKRWTVAEGETTLGPSGFSWATGMSSDGTRVAGMWTDLDGVDVAPFLWSLEGGTTRLTDGELGIEGTIRGMSDNGRFLVGSTPGESDLWDAWVWSEGGGRVELPAVSSDFDGCRPTDVSDDGLVVVGSCWARSDSDPMGYESAAVRWDVGFGATVLETSGPLSTSVYHPTCTVSWVSRDGRRMVGECRGEARQWGTPSVAPLELPPTGWTRAAHASENAGVIVGDWIEDPQAFGIPSQAVVWLPAGEMRLLSEMLRPLAEVSELAEWKRLATADFVSDDGLVFAGTGALDRDGRSETHGIYRASIPSLSRATTAVR